MSETALCFVLMHDMSRDRNGLARLIPLEQLIRKFASSVLHYVMLQYAVLCCDMMICDVIGANAI